MQFGSKKAAAGIVAALALASATVPAYADPTPTPAGTETTPAASTSANTIDPNANVSLTIHKLLGDPQANNTGAPNPSVPSAGAGFQFRVQRLDLDLTDPNAWTTLSGITATNPGSVGVSDVGTFTTGADGTLTVATSSTPAFTVGAYIVTEIQNQGYSVAPPFIVTLPYSDASATPSGAWNYSRDVYPKNQNVTPNKQVDDSNGELGGNLAYTVNAPVPAGSLTQFIVRDPLNAALAVNAGSVTVTATGTNGAAVALTSGTDYTISTDNNTPTVTFTASGLTALQNARVSDSALQVHVAFTAKVVSVPADGNIPNTAYVDIPGGTVDTGAGATSTQYANLTVTKTGGPTADMAGAVFQVYQCRQNTDGTWQLLGDALNVETSADGTQTPSGTITTDNTATATAYGLPANSTSGAGIGTVSNQFCVLETKAPAGYVRNPQPQPVTYNAGTPGTFTVSVNNAKDTVAGQLPATGAFGIVIVFIVGGALVTRGVMTSRRDDSKHAA